MKKSESVAHSISMSWSTSVRGPATAKCRISALLVSLFLASQELPPWFFERQNITRRPPGSRNALHERCRVRKLINHCAKTLPGVDLLSLDGLRAVRCLDAVAFLEVRRFLRVAKWVYKAGQMLLRLRVHRPGGTEGLCSSPVVHIFYLNGLTSRLPMWLSGG